MPPLDPLNKNQAWYQTGLCNFLENKPVQLVRTVECEAYVLGAGQCGTVVAVYGGGQAYAVEFLSVGGEMAVLTIAAEDLAEVGA